MIIFRSESEQFPEIPVWTLIKDKLKDEKTITLVNGLGMELTFDRLNLSDKYEKGYFDSKIVTKENSSNKFIKITPLDKLVVN